MHVHKIKPFLSGMLCLGLCLSYSSTYAAQAINLSKKNFSVLQSVKVEETSRAIDFNQTLHVRVQETYLGYPVWGGDAVVHIPQGANTAHTMEGVLAAAKNNRGSMNGTVYQNFGADLTTSPSNVFTDVQAKNVSQAAVDAYQRERGNKLTITDVRSTPMIFIGKDNKAHWAYKVNFSAAPTKDHPLPAKPVYIMDAVSSAVYEQWDDIKTVNKNLSLEDVFAGGFGGNQKMGKLVYDGLNTNLPKLAVKRDASAKTCYLQNADVLVRKCTLFFFGQCYQQTDFTTSCAKTDPSHNNVYWNGETDAINGGYSPSNDAFFAGTVIKDMYQKWYGLQVLTKNGKPMILTMVVHLSNFDNAYWDGDSMNFGDGYSMFYPLTSLGVGAHEISHGFTEQHSNLTYTEQSGGMNEAYSDIAAQGAEFFAYGKNSWQIGPEIFKAENQALRYMDQPSKDCYGQPPGDNCSIDTASQYNDNLNVHYSSGVYNHFFYLLGTSPGWDTKKAFDVMVQADANYWTANSTFVEGACGVIKATQDYKYDVMAVKKAFDLVEINTDQCS